MAGTLHISSHVILTKIQERYFIICVFQVRTVRPGEVFATKFVCRGWAFASGFFRSSHPHAGISFSLPLHTDSSNWRGRTKPFCPVWTLILCRSIKDSLAHSWRAARGQGATSV